jgi:hypothetical protein
MKATTTILIVAVLALQVNVLFAGNDLNSTPVANANNTITLTSLAPIVLAEATFEDAIDITDFAYLAPATPREAQFEDISYETISVLNLAPLTPAVADFEDEIDISSLAPIVPAEADFE